MKRTALAVTSLVTLTLAITAFKSKSKQTTDHGRQTTNCKPQTTNLTTSYTDTILYPGEKHFKNIQQLTFGGDNAEAYFSFDGKWLIFQRTNPKEGIMCDEMFIGKIPKPGEKFEYRKISSGKGRTTCGFFMKDGKHVIYASTHLGADTCPPVPDRSKYGNKYIWP